MKKTTLLLSTLFALGVSSTLFLSAQVNQQVPHPTVASPQATPQFDVLADVNLGDVSFTKKEGFYTGTFSLLSRMGQQNDIAYGVIVYDEKGLILDAKHVGQVASIKEGEIAHESFTYRLPGFISGDVSMSLVAENKAGLRLGTAILERKLTLRGAGRNILCTPKSSTTVGDSITCDFKTSTTVTVTKRSALFGDPILPVMTITAKKGEKKNITITGEPGSYYVFIEDTKGDEQKILPAKIAGVSGKIINVSLSSTKNNILHLIAYLRLPTVVGNTLKYELRDADGKVCSSETVALTDIVLTKDVQASCVDGKISMTLIDKTGKTLDSRDESFSVMSTLQENDQSKKMFTSINLKNTLLTLIALVFLVAVFTIFRKRMIKVGIFAAFLVVSFCGLQKADALTYSIHTMGPAGCSGCEVAHICSGDINVDKPGGYTAGDTMVVTSTLHIDYDSAGAGPSSFAACSVGYHNTGSAPIYDSGGAFMEGSPTIVNSPTVSTPSLPYDATRVYGFAIPSTMTVGSHFIGLRPCLDSMSPSSSSPPWHSVCSWPTLTFSVTTAATTVNVFFSYLASAVKAWL